VTVTSPGTELDAADRGLGCLGVATASYAEQERRTREYHRRIQLCDPVGAAVNDRVAILIFCTATRMRTPPPSTACASSARSGCSTRTSCSRARCTRRRPISRWRTSPRAVAEGRARRPAGCADGICIGDPKGIIAAIKRWESIGVDQINVLLNASEVLTQDQVLASLRLFAKEVMPVFERAC